MVFPKQRSSESILQITRAISILSCCGQRCLPTCAPGRGRWRQRIIGKAYLAQNVFRAVLVQRGAAAQAESEEEARAAGRATIEQLAEALGETDSLILFPEGTRGTGEAVAPFRSGLFHLAKRKPDAELVPVYLENLNRILPKGEFLPVPLISVLTFGAPMLVEESESKEAFLERARAAVCGLRRGEHAQ